MYGNCKTVYTDIVDFTVYATMGGEGGRGRGRGGGRGEREGGRRRGRGTYPHRGPVSPTVKYIFYDLTMLEFS